MDHRGRSQSISWVHRLLLQGELVCCSPTEGRDSKQPHGWEALCVQNWVHCWVHVARSAFGRLWPPTVKVDEGMAIVE